MLTDAKSRVRENTPQNGPALSQIHRNTGIKVRDSLDTLGPPWAFPVIQLTFVLLFQNHF